MSALVGYGSSSEEDEPPRRENTSELVTVEHTIDSTHTKNGQPGASSTAVSTKLDIDETANNRDVDGPIVGPSMPNDIGHNDQQSSPSETQQPMSERDVVRYLTQASHPMASIPPSPPGSPDPALKAKFGRFLELKEKGVHFNDDLARKSTFQNPSLLSTMIVRVGLDEHDQYKTSLPEGLWDPTAFPPSAYKEELLRSQQSLREQELATKKSLSASGKRIIEFSSAGVAGSTSSRESTPGMPNKRKRP